MIGRLRFFVIIILTLVFLNDTFGEKLKGRVIDKESGEPLFNVNIYLSGTLWGTTSDENGYYEIRSIIPSDYEVVFSIIGYETQSKTVFIKQNRTVEINIGLRSKSYELENITVASDQPESWYKNLETFKEFFLGRTKFADECVIKNEIYLEFANPQQNILSAKISRPLEIINYALGFKINCELMSFRYDSYDNRLKYYIMTHFEKMDTTDADIIQKWRDNRKEAYLGSLDHFLSSLKKDSFLNEGFEISTTIFPLKSGYDLYRKIILSSDSLLTSTRSSDISTLKFNKYLQIEYKKAESKFKPFSWLKIMGMDVTLDKYGSPMELMPFEVHGSWSYSGVADMLPKYYFVSDSISEI